jgi:periplasmic divalent cation tolerance protein
MALGHPSDPVLVSTTFETPDEARKVAEHMVRRRFAACAQLIGPIESTYWWQDTLETAREWLLLLKTTRRRYPEVEEELLRIHPYEVPEVTAVPIEMGSDAYLRWVWTETELPPSEEDDAL